MLLELLALFIGIIAGTITGLIPGIHINLISSLSLTLPSAFFSFPLAIFITSMSITHTFTDFLPSIFLGAPDEDSALSVLPGHKLLLQGKGYLATLLTVYGSLAGIFIIILFIPIFIYILPIIYPYIEKFIPFILILASLFLLIKEENKFLAIIIFLLAGTLGLVNLNLNISNPLLPLLSGLFGSSTLLNSILQKTKIKKQSLKTEKIKKRKIFSSIIPSIFASPLVSFLPSLGASQAAIISLGLKNKQNPKSFLILLGSINTVVMGLSFITLYTIQKARTGSALAVSKILSNFSFNHLIILLTTIIISAIFASYITLFLAKKLAKNITKIKYSLISILILIFITIIIIYLSNFLGFLTFLAATCLGIFCILKKVRRIHLMGALMLPVIIFYLF